MLKIDKYYDIRCDRCGLARSTDYDGGLGMWDGNAESFRKIIEREGWNSVDHMNLCPLCSKKENKGKNYENC